MYENLGSGHKRVADILETMLADDKHQIISCAAGDLFNDQTIRLVQSLWTYFLQHNWITLTDTFINFFLRLSVGPVAEVLQTGPYYKILEALAPDIIICTCDVFGKLLGAYARDKSIPFYMVITDVAVFADLANPYATHICYFSETIQAIRSFDFNTIYFATHLNRETTFWNKLRYVIKMDYEYILLAHRNSIFRNIDPLPQEQNQAACIAVGPIVAAKYYSASHPVGDTPKNKLAVRRKLGLEAERPMLLLISGSMGGAYLNEMLRAFHDICQEHLTILVVCGKDKQSYRQVTAIKDNRANIEVRVFGFVENLEELYAAADVVLARPSAGVFLESMVTRRPLIIPAKAAANDRGTVELVRRYRLGQVYYQRDDVPHLFSVINRDYQQYIDNIETFLAPYPATFSDLTEVMQAIILPGKESATRDEFRSRTKLPG